MPRGLGAHWERMRWLPKSSKEITYKFHDLKKCVYFITVILIL